MKTFKDRKQEIRIAVDAICIAVENNEEYILLIQRQYEPFMNRWALPGGFVINDEELEISVLRELEEETGLNVEGITPIQVGAFGKIGRDPRRRIISIAYLIKLNERKPVKILNETLDVQWIKLSELNFDELAFDHSEIIKKAITLFDKL